MFFFIFCWLIPILSLSITNLHKGIPLFLFVICAFCFIKNSKYNLLLYIILLPTNGLLLKQDYLLGFIGLKQVVGIFVLAFFYIKRKFFINSEQTPFTQIASRILTILTVYLCYSAFNQAFWGIGDMSYLNAIQKAINIIPLYLPLFFILRWKAKLNRLYCYDSLLTVGGLNMIVFALLSPLLNSWGLYSGGIDMVNIDSIEVGKRFYGVIGNGDVNSLGIFCAIFIGYWLSIIEEIRDKVIIYILILLCIIVIALTGSRTSFLATCLLLFFYFYYNKNVTNSILIFCLLTIVGIVFFPLWETTLSRFGTSSTEFETTGNSSRLSKWIAYVSFFNKHPITYVTGTNKELLLGWNGTYRAAHNLFIQMIYNSGLIFVLLLLTNYFELIKLGIKKAKYNLFLIFFPLFLINMYVSDIVTIFYFLIFISMNSLKKKKGGASC